MAEINLAQAHREKTWAANLWDSRKFAELMAYSATDAAQYAVDCNINTNIHGMSAQDFVNKQKGIVKAEVVEEIVVEPTVKEEVIGEQKASLSKEDLQELLKANNIKFHPATGIEKLVNIAKENNLL